MTVDRDALGGNDAIAAGEGAERRPPGRPRSTKVRRKILEATAELLKESGYAALSIEGVAARSGVAKTTIYRRWASLSALVVDVLVEADRQWPMPVPKGRSLAEDLAELHANWLEGLAGAGKVIPSLIAEAVHNPSIAEILRETFIRPRRQQAVAIVRHAAERGEIPDTADHDNAIDMFMGRLWYHQLVTGESDSAAGGGKAIDLILHGLTASRRR